MTNITVEDGLVNGAIGKLVHIEKNDQGEVQLVYVYYVHHLNEKLK